MPTAHFDGRHPRTVFFSHDHTRGVIYNDELRRQAFLAGQLTSLTMFPTDQILLARLLADRDGCMVHSSAVIIDGWGYLFVGHSDAGKSTMVELVRGRGDILCDDRNIVRKIDGRFRVFGTWSHGDVPDVCGASAPLKGIFFLHQSQACRVVAVGERRGVAPRLLACLVKPLVTADWWDKSLHLVADLVCSVPAYELYFDRSGAVVDKLRRIDERKE